MASTATRTGAVTRIAESTSGTNRRTALIGLGRTSISNTESGILAGAGRRRTQSAVISNIGRTIIIHAIAGFSRIARSAHAGAADSAGRYFAVGTTSGIPGTIIIIIADPS